MLVSSERLRTHTAMPGQIDRFLTCAAFFVLLTLNLCDFCSKPLEKKPQKLVEKLTKVSPPFSPSPGIVFLSTGNSATKVVHLLVRVLRPYR